VLESHPAQPLLLARRGMVTVVMIMIVVMSVLVFVVMMTRVFVVQGLVMTFGWTAAACRAHQ
jgi:hypothetical protein